mgnify:CR=1 FL=1
MSVDLVPLLEDYLMMTFILVHLGAAESLTTHLIPNYISMTLLQSIPLMTSSTTLPLHHLKYWHHHHHHPVVTLSMPSPHSEAVEHTPQPLAVDWVSSSPLALALVYWNHRLLRRKLLLLPLVGIVLHARRRWTPKARRTMR